MAELFFSYSHRDEDLRNELEVHLAMLKRQGLINAWHDRRIGPGQHVDHAISEHLETANIILLLVSPYFLASDYCYDVEMKRALERHQAGAAVVIPVILHPSDWQSAPFNRLRATPKDGKPISKFANAHDAFLEVTNDIRLALGSASPEAEPTPRDRSPEPSRPAAPHARTSNLRMRKEFTDKERDDFLDMAFEYIRNFFEGSLEELRARNSHVDVRFKNLGDTAFSAAVYVGGERRTGCHIALKPRAHLGDITYSMSETPSNGINDSMRIESDGYVLGLKPLGLSSFGLGREEMLSTHGAAEYFWTVFLRPLQ